MGFGGHAHRAFPTVKQNNVVGNIIEEWIDSWLTEHDFDHIYNHGQCSPDFWLNPDDMNDKWLDIHKGDF